MNIDDLKKAVADICQVLNCVSKALSGQGILSLIGAVSAFEDLAVINWGAVKQELLKIDSAGKDQLNFVIQQNLKLANPVAQAKVLAAVDCVEQAVDLGEEAVSLYNQGKNLVDKVKALIS